MTIQYEMKRPRKFESGCFDAVLDCGSSIHNRWLEIALNYLPKNLFAQNTKGFLFTSTATRDACRVARHYCRNREIILISERILPAKNVTEDDTKARYFIYVVLHEVAHALRKHKSPLFDGLTEKDKEAQEKEADELAMSWFNDHVARRKNKYLRPITKQEIEATQDVNQRKMKAGI